jgi:O-antigen/teichoic acid export membrane protein
MSASPQQEQYEAHVGRIARGAGISSFGEGIGRLLNYVTQIALARMYGPASLGFYVLGITVVQVANVLAQFGMNQGVVRYVAHYRAQKDVARVRGTILMVLWIGFALSLMLAGLIFFCAGFLAESVFSKPSLEAAIRAFSVSLPFFTVMSLAIWATQGFQTVKYDAYVQHIQRPLLNLVLVLIFYFLGAQVLGAVAAYILSMAAGAVFALYYLKRIFPKLLDRDTPPKFEPRALFGVSAPMVVANFTQYMNSWVVVVVLGALATAESVGIFNAAARTAGLSALVLAAFKIFSPMVSNLYGRGELEDLGNLYRDVSRWSFTGSLALFLVTVLLARDIMTIFGSEFVSGWAVMVVIAAGQLFNSSAGPGRGTLAMTGHQRIVMFVTLGSVATSFALGVTLIPLYGGMGAGVATATGLILSNIIVLFFVRRLLGLWPYGRGYLKPLTAGLLAAAVAHVVKLLLPLPTGILTILVVAPLFLACLVAFVLAFGLSPGDRQFLAALRKAVLARSPARRLKRTSE